jgi:hypothetical protein
MSVKKSWWNHHHLVSNEFEYQHDIKCLYKFIVIGFLNYYLLVWSHKFSRNWTYYSSWWKWYTCFHILQKSTIGIVPKMVITRSWLSFVMSVQLMCNQVHYSIDFDVRQMCLQTNSSTIVTDSLASWWEKKMHTFKD